MYLNINGNFFHLKQSYQMGKDAFVKAHKSSVRDVVKVWEQIERAYLEANAVGPEKTKVEKAPKKK